MQRRALLATLGVGTAGLLAGCSAPTALIDDEDAVEDVDWLDGDDLDADVLATRHADALSAAGSFELLSTADTDHEEDEEPSPWLASQEYEAAFESERGRQYLRQEMVDVDEPDVFELYVEGPTAFIRERQGDAVATDRRAIGQPDAFFNEEFETESTTGVRGVGGWNMRVDDRAVGFDGEPAARLVADEFVGDAGIPETVDVAEATMVVTGDGVVRSLDQRWDGTQGGQGATVAVDIAFREVGSKTIDEPEWVWDLRE